MRGRDRVVGVDEEGRGLREGAGEGAECVDLAGKGDHVGVGHGPRGRDTVAVLGEHVAAHDGAGEERAPGGFHPGIDAGGAPEAELDDRASTPREDGAGGLGGEDRLEVAGVHDGRLDELGLADGRGDLQERLIREDDGPLGDRPHVAREPQVGKKAEEPIVEPARGLEVRERVLGEAEALEVAEDVLEPRGDEERAILRELSHEEAERGGLCIPPGSTRRPS